MDKSTLEYLNLELQMFLLERDGSSTEAIMDRMDFLWIRMPKADHRALDRRIIGQVVTTPIEFPISDVLLYPAET